MQSATSVTRWHQLSEPGDRLAAARRQCHHAVQLNTRFARAFAQPKEDDSHTSLSWDFEHHALVGVPAASFRIGLRIADLTFLLLDSIGATVSTFPLHGQTFSGATEWLAGIVRHEGFDPAPLANRIHFELDDHPLLHGARFESRTNEAELQELARWYANAASCLEAIGQPVRCWPHHFDIATQLSNGETIGGGRTIGAGLSPGDASYNEPYFYVTLWPSPDPTSLRPLRAGKWHTQGWTGAALSAHEILRHADQRALVSEFLRDVIDLYQTPAAF